MTHSIFLLIFFGYFVSFVLYFMNFESQRETHYAWAQRAALFSIFFQLVFILATFVKTRFLPVTHLSEYYIEIVSFIILFVSLVIESRYNARYLMLFSLPIVLIFCLFTIVLAEQKDASVITRTSGWLWFHIGLILAGISSLIIAVSSALMYLLQSTQLKSKHLGRIFLKLPALGTLDRIHFRSLVWGILLFSLGMLMGLLWAKNIHELKHVLKDPTVVLSFLTCFMYWIILSFRFSAIRRGQKIAIGTVLALTLLFLILLSSNVTPTGFHRGL
ncbi:MAG: hypothetical protein COT00_03420 [Candidatus Omnitrophica bacterium CG07_land_8_20_14_0_80_50_8]|nr:MAG: hypothetical protein COT00_03420 [Candidatus Omnitrophica bacterium CG07_land_8_20_14_0_80_50_8]